MISPVNELKFVTINKLIPYDRRFSIIFYYEIKIAYFLIPKNAHYSIMESFKPNKFKGICDLNYFRFPVRNFFNFVFLRNPVDRFISAYKDKVIENSHLGALPECKGMSLDQFIEYCEGIDLTKSDRHIRKQLTFFNPKEMHFIGTIENYEHDLRLLSNILDRDLAYYHNHRTKLILKPNHDQFKKILNLFYEDYKFWEDIYNGF